MEAISVAYAAAAVPKKTELLHEIEGESPDQYVSCSAAIIHDALGSVRPRLRTAARCEDHAESSP